jgi:hypothetical protein
MNVRDLEGRVWAALPNQKQRTNYSHLLEKIKPRCPEGNLNLLAPVLIEILAEVLNEKPYQPRQWYKGIIGLPMPPLHDFRR